MEINRHAPATAEGELRIDADPQTVFAVISAIGHLKTEAERRAVTA